ncbi:MAG: hypothetical protein MRJ92_01380 [Nitrospira sp.]|nr:hypothetical protein [Nitrospira sp.]
MQDVLSAVLISIPMPSEAPHWWHRALNVGPRAALGTRETELATMGALTYALRVTEHMSNHQ